MAKDKKSFILYADLVHVVRKLIENDRTEGTNNAGELFLQVLEYVNDTNPVAKNFIVDMAFEPIKLQLKRDLKDWESKLKQRSEAGKKSAESRSTKSTTVKSRSTKSTDTVNVTVTDIDTVKENENTGIYRQFAHLRISETEVSKLLDDGFTMQQIDEILDSIQNYKGNKKYTSLYLTAKKWLKKDTEGAKKTKSQIAEDAHTQAKQELKNEIKNSYAAS